MPTAGYGHAMTTSSTTDDPSPWRSRLKTRSTQMWERLDQRRRSLAWLIVAAWAVAAGTVAAMTVLAWLVLDTPQWQPPEQLTPRNLDAITTRAFAIVAGLGGVAFLVIAFRRQRATENADQREITRLFTERFTTASEQLGSEQAAVRLAGVHALAHLADDAPEDRDDLVQMVIDVLCAYSRMPYEPAPEPLPKRAGRTQREEHRKRDVEFAANREVRHTIIRVIGNHLREPTRWRGKDYDFTGVVFDGGDLRSAVFSGGQVNFFNAEFIGDHVDFLDVEFSGGRVNFHGAKFSSGEVDLFGARFSGGDVSFSDAEFTGGHVGFSAAEFTDGSVDFFDAHFVGAHVSFPNAEFAGGHVKFTGARFTDGEINFEGAEFTDGEVDFSGATFTGAQVDFTGARFAGGDVVFARDFPYGGGREASGTCPIGLLEAVGRGEPNTVALPDAWRSTGKPEVPGTPDDVTTPE